MITLIADEGKDGLGLRLHGELLARGADCLYIPLERMVVEPCRNCGGCTYKSFNRCVVRDDGDRIFPHMLQADPLVLVTPVVFGSYSFRMKRVLDKLGLIMDRHYFVQNGEMVKGGKQGGQFRLIAVGVREGCSREEKSAFFRLVRENLIITRGAGGAFVVDPAAPQGEEASIVREVLGA